MADFKWSMIHAVDHGPFEIYIFWATLSPPLQRLPASRASAEGPEPFPPDPDLRLRSERSHLLYAHGIPPGAVPFLSYVLPGPFHVLVSLRSVAMFSSYTSS